MAVTQKIQIEDAEAVAADLWLLSRLHGREFNTDEQKYLLNKPFQEHFVCQQLFNSEEFDVLFAKLQECLQQVNETLQSEYAALYLNFMARVSPCLSFYEDKDHLLRQEITFQLADIYAQEQYSLESSSPLSTDHVAILLSFLSMMFLKNPQKMWEDFGKDFMENHLLSWLPIFIEGCDHSKFYHDSFYRHLFALTDMYLKALRDHLP